MALLPETFNPADVPESENDFSPIPAGKYNVTVEEANLKDTKAGTGCYINLKLRVNGPTHANRVLFDIVNFINPSAKAQEIGRQQLKKICDIANIGKFEDTDQLVGAVFDAKVSIEKSDQYGESNRIKSYSAPSGGMPSTPTAAQQFDNPTESKPFWAK